MSADLAYKNHPVKFTVYIFDIDITQDVESFGNIETSLDYPQISEFRIGEANLVLRDYNAEGEVGRKYNPEYMENFFNDYGLASGYKSPVRIEVQFLVGDTLEPKDPIIIFEGRILSLNKGLKEGTVNITCSDLTQELRTKNLDNFGIPKQFALAKGELSNRAGDYPFPYFLAPPSDKSVIHIDPPQMQEVEKLKTIGPLDELPYKFLVTDRSIQIQHGFLKSKREIEQISDTETESTVKDINPIFFFKSPFRNRKIESLVKRIVAHYGYEDSEIEVPEVELENKFFTSLGKVGYDFDKRETREKWKWEGFVTDFIAGEDLASLDQDPFNYNFATTPLDQDDRLTAPRGLVDGIKNFYTTQGSLYNGKIHQIDTVTGRATKAFQLGSADGSTPNVTPLMDGLIHYKDYLLILTLVGSEVEIYKVNIFRTHSPSSSLKRVIPRRLNLREIVSDNSIVRNNHRISSSGGIGGPVKSLVYHDEKHFLIAENGLWRLDLEDDEENELSTAELTRIGFFVDDFANDDNPRIICAASYGGILYGIGQKDDNYQLYKINHYNGKATSIQLSDDDQQKLNSQSPQALGVYNGNLYFITGTTIAELDITTNPYQIEIKSLYKNSGGDKLFFLYSSPRIKTIPKIVEYDIKTDTYTELYSYQKGFEGYEKPEHAEFWKIASDDYKTFYILGTELQRPLPDRQGDNVAEFGVYDSSTANYASPSQVKIWKFDRVSLDFKVYVHQESSPVQSENPIIPIGKAPPQLAQYYHPLDVKPDSRKNFQVHNGTLYYIWANNKQFGVASASGSGTTPLIRRIFVGLNDAEYNTCGCDFAIHKDKIYGAFTFINTLHKYSTFNIYKASI